MNNIRVKTPGTCGELVQGMIDGNKFHITCPVNIFSCVSVSGDGSNGSSGGSRTLPSNKWKTQRAVEKTLQLFKSTGENISVSVSSEIPEGRGMASSTADVTGACLAVSAFLGGNIKEDEVARIALAIEPSDGIMFKGIVMFDHLNGRVFEYLGEALRMKMLIIDSGERIDTLEFNRADHTGEHLSNRDKILEAIELVRAGVKKKDVAMLGRGATISALCNQKIIHKPWLPGVMKAAEKFGCPGVNVAHSGSAAGVLLETGFNKIDALKSAILTECNREFDFYETGMTGGGGVIC
ncbi:MAG: hypothetical protein ABIJ11_04480 [Elusimicrobiota bacterium]